MKRNLVISFILILNLTAAVSATEIAYQWTDRRGQIHYGDEPPSSINSRPIMLQQDSKRVENQAGLRPGEQEQIEQIEQRQKQQQRRAQAARARTDNRRAARRTDCAKNRELFEISRGRDAFKQYARYLRNNCW